MSLLNTCSYLIYYLQINANTLNLKNTNLGFSVSRNTLKHRVSLLRTKAGGNALVFLFGLSQPVYPFSLKNKIK